MIFALIIGIVVIIGFIAVKAFGLFQSEQDRADELNSRHSI